MTDPAPAESLPPNPTPPGESAAAARPPHDADSVIVRPMPKVVFFYLTWLVSLVFGIIATAAGAGGTPEHLGTIWMVIFAFNILVISFDFTEVVSIAVISVLMMLVFAGLWLKFLPFIGEFFRHLDIQMNAGFYFTIFGLFSIIYLVVFVRSRFEYWEFRHNEVLHRSGHVLGDQALQHLGPALVQGDPRRPRADPAQVGPHGPDDAPRDPTHRARARAGHRGRRRPDRRAPRHPEGHVQVTTGAPAAAGDDPLPKIQADTSAAMKAGDKARVSVLRMVASDLKKAAIDQGVDVVRGEAALAVLRRCVKSRQDSVDQFDKAGRTESADKERAEIVVIETYLPRGASEADVRAAAKAIVAEKGLSGPAAMGPVIKETMARLGGTADGKLVSRVVGELLRGA